LLAQFAIDILPTIASLVGFEQTPANRATNSIATHLIIN
jgi:hypothetical protein